MNLSDIDLNLFVVFEAIYNEGNLTRAGQVVGITQPAVSNALSRLRDTFDDQLFIRSSQGMVPTPLAQNIIGAIRQSLQLMRNSVQHGNEFVPAKADKLFRFSMGDLTEALFLPAMFSGLAKVAPRVRIESFQVRRREASKELASGRLDFVIDANLPLDEQLHHVQLYEERYVCVLRKDHPLSVESITPEQYLALDHIQVSSRRSGLGYVDLALGKLGLQRRIALRANYNLMASRVVKKTDMALTIPYSLVANDPDLRVLELPFKGVDPLQCHLYWHDNSEHDASSIWMRSFLTAMALKEFGRGGVQI
ncbi:LysR family transcriptional regulator [Aestuariirhabdus litorea]|uniref:LysR family transcriptional regulator n=1 Tax=Aestuariirhabdus litorea TaxID=2528527 RepID=A0A3P3VPM3_9GAMM|nr:LysR family transcriptional regulator [Aestuariirhabdus litorea]RRJ84712.1 LysR family transcriptional regulator [Aestuariirhabdus litorea]RWW97937.1 LysR family transcriptional regulator [Endozoicomonadaceae bacterium GTF-13]